MNTFADRGKTWRLLLEKERAKISILCNHLGSQERMRNQVEARYINLKKMKDNYLSQSRDSQVSKVYEAISLNRFIANLEDLESSLSAELKKLEAVVAEQQAEVRRLEFNCKKYERLITQSDDQLRRQTEKRLDIEAGELFRTSQSS
jgi:uncharacterized coiled-coil protein SlyX